MIGELLAKILSRGGSIILFTPLFVLFGYASFSFAATGNVRVDSAIIAEDGQSVSASVQYIVTSDDVPEASSTYYTNGYYKECFSPTLDLSDSCNTHRYAYFRRTTDLLGSFSGSRSVETFWCPGGDDDMGVLQPFSETLRVPAGYSGGDVVTATYYLQDVAGYGYQLYYGQIYSCNTGTAHPDYNDVFASATLTLKLCDNGQSFCCVDGDGDGFYAMSAVCSEGNDCDDSDPEVKPGSAEICDDGVDNDCNGLQDCEDLSCMGQPMCLPTVNIPPEEFPRDCKLNN